MTRIQITQIKDESQGDTDRGPETHETRWTRGKEMDHSEVVAVDVVGAEFKGRTAMKKACTCENQS